MTTPKFVPPQRNPIVTNVTFRLCSDEIELIPEEITENLGVQPHKAWKKGDVRSKHGFRTTYYTFGNWSFKPDCSKYLELEQQLTILLDKLDQLPEILLEYVHKYTAVILIRHYSGEDHMGFHFYTDIIHRLSKYNLEIDVDMHPRFYYSSRIFTARYIRQRKGYRR